MYLYKYDTIRTPIIENLALRRQKFPLLDLGEGGRWGAKTDNLSPRLNLKQENKRWGKEKKKVPDLDSEEATALSYHRPRFNYSSFSRQSSVSFPTGTLEKRGNVRQTRQKEACCCCCCSGP